MKNIIVPVDFSKHSEYALETAAILARKHDATLHVLHMLELSESLISNSSNDNTNEMMFLLALSKKKFEPFLDKDYLVDVKMEAIIKHHKVYKEVDDLAQSINADLIVMGSKGLTPSQSAFSGSNTEKMVRNSSTPVLTIKSSPDKFSLQKVILATDLSVASVSAYQRASQIFSRLGSSIQPVFINRPHNNFISSVEFKKMSEEFAAAGGTDQVAFIAAYNIEDGLLQFAEETKANCIAISTHARKGLSHFFIGSVSEDLANQSQLPVMSFKL